MSLRNRVLLGFLAITFLLVATDVVIAVSVHRSLIDQVDRRIAAAIDHTPPSRLPGFAGSSTSAERIGPARPTHRRDRRARQRHQPGPDRRAT